MQLLPAQIINVFCGLLKTYSAIKNLVVYPARNIIITLAVIDFHYFAAQELNNCKKMGGVYFCIFFITCKSKVMLAATEEKIAFVEEIHHRLSKVYGSGIKYFHDLDPLSELMSSLLSHRTKNRDSGKAFDNLVEQFGTWESVRDASTSEVEAAIKPCTWPEQKAPRIQQVLRMITEQNDGNLSIDFIKNMSVEEARQWLEKLPGVGPKTSAAVISFSTLRGKALPVDSHHFRVAARLGIVDKKIGEAKANRVLESLLPPDFTAQDVYDNHQLLMKHGQNVCFHYHPNCDGCVLLDLCPTGKELVEKRHDKN